MCAELSVYLIPIHCLIAECINIRIVAILRLEVVDTPIYHRGSKKPLNNTCQATLKEYNPMFILQIYMHMLYP